MKYRISGELMDLGHVRQRADAFRNMIEQMICRYGVKKVFTDIRSRFPDVFYGFGGYPDTESHQF
jgi:hypothetical protein